MFSVSEIPGVETFGGPEMPTNTALLEPLAPFGGDADPEPVEGVGTSSGGYVTEGDIVPRVTATADNVDLNVIWQEMANALGEWNRHRTAIVDLLSYWHTSVADAVPQALVESMFEEATEFGEPLAAGPPTEYLLLGYDFKDYDRATRFTWRFLRDSDARQVRAVHDDALRSDNATVTTKILERLFNPEPVLNEQGIVCYGLWTGNDNITPPPVLGKSFDSTHSHYHATGNNTVDAGDLEFAVKDIREHGYGRLESAQELIALAEEFGDSHPGCDEYGDRVDEIILLAVLGCVERSQQAA
jgi:hypothetical protein